MDRKLSHWLCHTCFGEMWLFLDIKPRHCAHCGCRFDELRKTHVDHDVLAE